MARRKDITGEDYAVIKTPRDNTAYLTDIMYLLAAGNSHADAAMKINSLYPERPAKNAQSISAIKYQHKEMFQDLVVCYKEAMVTKIKGNVEHLLQWVNRAVENLQAPEESSINLVKTGVMVLRELTALRREIEAQDSGNKAIPVRDMDQIESTVKGLIGGGNDDEGGEDNAS